MLYLFMGLLILIIAVLVVRLLLLHRSIDSIAGELRQINQQEPAHRHLQVPLPDSHLELLATEINRCLSLSFERSYEQKKREQDIRREIANISHDLRTPLTSILGYLELLDEESLSPEQRECLATVQKRSKSLNTLISQLYEYARLEARELPLHMEAVDLTGALKEHLLSYYQEFENKGLELRPSLPDSSMVIYADREALERILQNLTSNMLRHSRGRAAVTLSLEGGWAVLSYINDASGLTAENVQHLFDPFYTADQARTSQSSGLGMTVARLLAQQMNGQINALLKNGQLTVQCRFPVGRGLPLAAHKAL